MRKEYMSPLKIDTVVCFHKKLKRQTLETKEMGKDSITSLGTVRIFQAKPK